MPDSSSPNSAAPPKSLSIDESAALKRSHRVAWGFFAATILGLPLAILPGLAFLFYAAFPWLAIVVVDQSRGQIRLSLPSPYRMDLLASAFGITGGVLWALAQGEFVNWLPLLPWGAVVAATLTLLAVKVDPESISEKRIIVYAYVVSLLYGVGLTAGIDTNFDETSAVVHRVQVVRKEALNDRNNRYSLTLAPWGPYTEEKKIKVRENVGVRVEPGSEICITLSRGTLRVPWFTAEPCER